MKKKGTRQIRSTLSGARKGKKTDSNAHLGERKIIKVTRKIFKKEEKV